MPSVSIQAGSVAVTGASATTGLLTVGSTTGIFPGTWAWLGKTDGSGSPVKVKIIKVPSATTILVRVFANDADEYGNGQSVTQPYYTFKDVSAFATVSTLNWWTQSVPVDPSFTGRAEA